jgi:tetratricopeptide (TPR) repeat protein
VVFIEFSFWRIMLGAVRIQEPFPASRPLILAYPPRLESLMKTSTKFLAIPLLLIAWSAFGAGGGGMPSGGGGDFRPQEPPRPEELARSTYNAGVRAVEKADGQVADAARQTDERKQKKLKAKAESAYAAAARKFTRATELRPAMHEAWNYLGYSQRKLSRYDAALTAYDRALTLKPGYPEALEYRGHAYLGLNRLGDAKDAYLALFASNRKLAASLLTGMQQWLGNHRAGAGVDPGSYDAFASWVRERGAIASQTAGLTREGAAAAW